MSDIDKAWQEFVDTQNEDDWSIWRRDIPDGESGARLLELVFKAGAQHQAAEHTKELLQTKPTKQSMEAMRNYLLSIGVPHDDELNPVFVKFFNQGWIHCSTVADMVAEEKYAAQSKELAEALRGAERAAMPLGDNIRASETYIVYMSGMVVSEIRKALAAFDGGE